MADACSMATVVRPAPVLNCEAANVCLPDIRGKLCELSGQLEALMSNNTNNVQRWDKISPEQRQSVFDSFNTALAGSPLGAAAKAQVIKWTDVYSSADGALHDEARYTISFYRADSRELASLDYTPRTQDMRVRIPGYNSDDIAKDVEIRRQPVLAFTAKYGNELAHIGEITPDGAPVVGTETLSTMKTELKTALGISQDTNISLTKEHTNDLGKSIEKQLVVTVHDTSRFAERGGVRIGVLSIMKSRFPVGNDDGYVISFNREDL